MSTTTNGSSALGKSGNNRTTIIFQILLIIGICVGLIAAGLIFGVFKKPATSHVVTYQISADSGFAVITYTGQNGKQTEPEKSTTPWERTVPFNSGAQVYLTAGTNNQSGDVVCKILLDRKAWKKETATDPASNVACGGIVP
jgi:hypothetical protein